MALHLTQHDIIRFKNQAEALKKRAASVIEKHHSKIEAVVRTVEVSGSAFAFGLLQGKFRKQGGVTILNVPVDLIAGAAFHALGLAGVAGSHSSHLHAFGDGALASYFTTLGRGVGSSWGGVAGSIEGDRSVSGGGSLADEELARMVSAAARK